MWYRMADAITELYIFLWNHKLLEVVLFLLVILSIWAVGLRIEKKIALPLAAKDTVGDLPIVEHFDDGRSDVLEKANAEPKVIVYQDRPHRGYFQGGMLSSCDYIFSR